MISRLRPFLCSLLRVPTFSALWGFWFLAGQAQAQTDTTPPTAAISSPASATHLSALSQLSGSATDKGSGVAGVSVRLVV